MLRRLLLGIYEIKIIYKRQRKQSRSFSIKKSFHDSLSLSLLFFYSFKTGVRNTHALVQNGNPRFGESYLSHKYNIFDLPEKT